MLLQVNILLARLALNIAVVLLVTLFDGIWFDANHWVVWPVLGFVVVNTLLPLGVLLSGLPMNAWTLAIFTVPVNAAVLVVWAWILPGFHMEGLWSHTGGCMIVAACNYALNWFFYVGRGRRIGRAH